MIVTMRLTVNGEQFDLDEATAVDRLRDVAPEPIQSHWVQVGGVRFPVKQALAVVLGINRTAFTSRTARLQFARLGLPTSTPSFYAPPVSPPAPDADDDRTSPVSVEQAAVAFATLLAFLRATPFTTTIGALEHALVDTDRGTAAAVSTTAGLTDHLLSAALTVRRDVGRVSDVIHATVIALALPTILEEGETIINRPSLGPGNDPSRPFDLETDRRVAEFKVAMWSSGNRMRQRGVTADLVHLAMDESGRRPELWVAGPAPLRFLRTSTSTVDDMLSRSSRHLRDRFETRYGTTGIPLRTFTAQHAAHVRLHDLAETLPTVAAALL